MDDARQGERHPSPLVGEDRLGRSPSEEGGRRGPTQTLTDAGGFEGAASPGCDGSPCPAAPLSARPSAESALPRKGGEGARWSRWLLVGAGALATVCLVAAVALWSFANSLGPLDLSAAEKRSTVVLDRDGRLLRPFATADGRWRLPVAAADVDPRFLAMLKAYEDRRFDRHPGIDPMALLRAAGQLLAHGRVVSGGSTLTMQVARLLEPREERTLAAKARQLVRA